MTNGSVLLIEDDEFLGATISENLGLEGYNVVWIQDGLEASKALSNNFFELVILDLMLPGIDGLTLLTEYRKKNRTPVMIISAKNSPEDRIKGLELEADDYLDKPFHLKEFLLRVRRLISQSRKSQSLTNAAQLVVGQAKFEFSKMSVSSCGATTTLSEKEVHFLKLLASKPNTVISRDEILDQVWGRGKFPSARTIDNFVVKFRKWIEKDPANPEFIISHRGIGYLLKIEGSDDV